MDPVVLHPVGQVLGGRVEPDWARATMERYW